MVKIKSISITSFRGIPDLTIDLEGKSVILKGENGSGKSSLVDSVEYFFTGKVSHLEGAHGLSLKEHGPHINSKPNDVAIKIAFDPGNISLTRTFKSPPIPPNHLEDYFKDAKTGTFILRRAQILEFIRSQPAERYKSIGNIIGIESLDATELEMMRLRDETKGTVDSNKQKTKNLLVKISETIGVEVKRPENILSELNKTLKKERLPLIKSLDESQKHAEEMLKTIQKDITSKKAQQIQEVMKRTNSNLITDDLIKQLRKVNRKVKALLAENAEKELLIIDLLEFSGKVLKEDSSGKCPVCEQKINRNKVLGRLGERIRLVRALSDEVAEIRQMTVPILDQLGDIVENLQYIMKRIQSIDELSGNKSKIQDMISFVSGLKDEVTSAKDLDNEISLDRVVQQKKDHAKLAQSLSLKCGELMDKIELSDEEKKILKIAREIEAVRQIVDEIEETQTNLDTAKKYHQYAEIVYSTFSDTKKKRVQEIYDSIRGDMERFFLTLHPNEPYEGIDLAVASSRRASTDLKIKSFGLMEDPRALSSEGHLDSLGLCIFLAFIKRFNNDLPLIILDDVVTAIDSRHRERICELLINEFKDKQIIVTTHDEIWYEQLRATQRAYGVTGNCKHLEIISWNVNIGPNIIPYKPQWEKIQAHISAGEKQVAGHLGRKYLEWVLKQICESLEASVPFKNSGKYEVGHLLYPAKRRSIELIKDYQFKQKVEASFRELERTSIMGNFLSHNNLLAEQASASEVQSFCNAVKSLHETFICPSCEQFPIYSREFKFIRCANDKCDNPLEVKTK